MMIPVTRAMAEAWAAAPLVRFQFAHRTRNPNNGSQGTTRIGAIVRAKKGAAERAHAQTMTRGLVRPLTILALRKLLLERKAQLIVTRIAPRKMDRADGLGASMKRIIDGVCDAFGVKDGDIEIAPARQERGKPREYAVRIEVELLSEAEEAAGDVASSM